MLELLIALAMAAPFYIALWWAVGEVGIVVSAVVEERRYRRDQYRWMVTAQMEAQRRAMSRYAGLLGGTSDTPSGSPRNRSQ